MIKPPSPYKVAVVAYNPAWPDMPWYVLRTGTIAEQGGLNFGTESLSFETLEAATSYILEATNRDLNILITRAEELEAKKDVPEKI